MSHWVLGGRRTEDLRGEEEAESCIRREEQNKDEDV